MLSFLELCSSYFRPSGNSNNVGGVMLPLNAFHFFPEKFYSYNLLTLHRFFFQSLLALGLAWILCYILTVTNVFPDDPDHKHYNARTDAKLYILEDSQWFFLPYPGICAARAQRLHSVKIKMCVGQILMGKLLRPKQNEELLSTVKRRKLKWYGHVTRASWLAKTVLQGTVREGRRRGRQRKRWEDNIRDWTDLELSDAVRRAEEREEWRMLVARSCGAPTVPKTMG